MRTFVRESPTVCPSHALLLVLSASLAGCGSAPDTQASFGPPRPGAAAPVAAEEALVAPLYGRAASVDAALPLRQARLDAGDAALQNYEVSIAVRPGGSGEDEVVAAWMTGRNPVSTLTRIRLARSSDGGATFTDVPLQVPPASQHIQVDPVLEYDGVAGRFYLGGMGVDPSGQRTLWLAQTAGASAATFGAAALVPTTSALPDKPWRYPQE